MHAKESHRVRLYVFSLVSAAAVLCAASAEAITWQITQLTDNETEDTRPRVSGDNIVWSGDGINLFDGATTTKISTTGSSPLISGNYVSWKDGGDIFLYDGATTTQVTNTGGGNYGLKMSGNNLVWRASDGNDDEIFLYDGSTTIQLTNNDKDEGNPSISGNNVVWEGIPDLGFGSFGESQIYLYDGLTTTNISSDTRPNEKPQISGNNVVWRVDSAGSAASWGYDIMYYNGTSSTQVTFDDLEDSDPTISGDRIAWRVRDEYTDYPTEDYEVFTWQEGGAATQLTNNFALDDQYAQVSGDLVVWGGEDGNDYEIFVNDGTTTTQLSDNTGNDYGPTADGNTIVWYGHDGNDYEIFMTTPVECLPGDLNLDGFIDIGGDIIPAFTNFTGPGSFCKTRAEGDVHGLPLSPCHDGVCPEGDGDVDVNDPLTIFGAFTGPAPDEGVSDGGSDGGGLVAAEAGDANIPDLIYNALTGEATLDVDGSGIIGYVLKNGSNSFAFGNHSQILAGVKTSVAGELSEAAFASSVGANSIGNVFPIGMDLASLTAYLTVNDVSRSLGAPVVPFDLVVLGPAVPEPSTFVMAALGLVGLGLFAARRRRS